MRRCVYSKADSERHSLATQVFELYLRLHAARAASLLVQTGSRSEFPGLPWLELLAEPSNRAFLEFARLTLRQSGQMGVTTFWDEPLPDDALAEFDEILNLTGVERSRGTWGEVLTRVPEVRNRIQGHGPQKREAFYQATSRALLGLAIRLVQRGQEMVPLRLFVVEAPPEQSPPQPTEVLKFLGPTCVRDRACPSSFGFMERGVQGRVLCPGVDGRSVDLYPYLRWHKGIIWYLNRARKTYARYVDFVEGSEELVPEALEAIASIIGEELPADDGSETGGASARFPFELGPLIGRGGMGEVFRAEQLSLGRPVAVKRLAPQLLGDATQFARFTQEVEVLSLCDHRNVVRILEHGIYEGRPYYAMELVDGCTLRELYEHACRVTTDTGLKVRPDHIPQIISAISSDRSDPHVGPSSENSYALRKERSEALARVLAPIPTSGVEWGDFLLPRFAEVAEALSEIHAKEVIHRDVTPANIMLSPGGDRAILMDFGLAKVGSTSLTRPDGSALGTERYMAPEQLLLRQTLVGPRTDLYGLGASMYELLTLSPLYAKDEERFAAMDRGALCNHVLHSLPADAMDRNPSLWRDVAVILEKLLQKQPDRRFYESAAELAEDLRNAAGRRPIKARPYTERERRQYKLWENLRSAARAWETSRSPDLLWGETLADELQDLDLSKAFSLDALETQFLQATLDHAARVRRRLQFVRRAAFCILLGFFVVVASLSGYHFWRLKGEHQLTLLALNAEKIATRAAEAASIDALRAKAAEHERAEEAERARQAAKASETAARQVADALEQQTNLATAQMLVSRTQFLLTEESSHLEEAALLAIASLRMNPSISGGQALRKALDLLPKKGMDMHTDSPVKDVRFLPDDYRSIVVLESGEALLVDVQDWKVLRRVQLGCLVSALSFSHDGRFLAIVCDDSRVQLVQSDLEEEAEEMERLVPGPIRAIGFTEGDTVLAAVVGDKSVEMWNVETSHSQKPYVADGPVNLWDISDHGMVVGIRVPKVRRGHRGKNFELPTTVVIDPVRGTIAGTIDVGAHPLHALVEPIGCGIVGSSAHHRGKMRIPTYLTEIRSGAHLSLDVGGPHGAHLGRSSVSPSGRWIVLFDRFGRVNLGEFGSSGRYQYIQESGNARNVVYSRNEVRAAVIGDEPGHPVRSYVDIIDLSLGERAGRILVADRIFGAALSDSDTLRVATWDSHGFVFWQWVTDGSVPMRRSWPSGFQVVQAKFLGDLSHLAARLYRGPNNSESRVTEIAMVLVDLQDGVVVNSQTTTVGEPSGFPGSFYASWDRCLLLDPVFADPPQLMDLCRQTVCEVPCGCSVEGFSPSGSIFLRKCTEGCYPSNELLGHRTVSYAKSNGPETYSNREPPWCLGIGEALISPRGQLRLHNCSQTDLPRTWRKDWRRTAQFKLANGNGADLFYLAENSLVALDLEGGSSRVLALAGEPTALAVAPTGNQVAVAFIDYVEVIDPPTGGLVDRISTEYRPWKMRFSSDSRRLAIMFKNNEVWVYEVPGGEPIFRVAHSNEVLDFWFSVDGERLGSISRDGDIYLHQLNIQNLILEACSRLQADLSLEQWERNVGLGIPYHPVCSFPLN